MTRPTSGTMIGGSMEAAMPSAWAGAAAVRAAAAGRSLAISACTGVSVGWGG